MAQLIRLFTLPSSVNYQMKDILPKKLNAIVIPFKKLFLSLKLTMIVKQLIQKNMTNVLLLQELRHVKLQNSLLKNLRRVKCLYLKHLRSFSIKVAPNVEDLSILKMTVLLHLIEQLMDHLFATFKQENGVVAVDLKRIDLIVDSGTSGRVTNRLEALTDFKFLKTLNEAQVVDDSIPSCNLVMLVKLH